jgi:predicted Zn-dependent protease
VGAPTRDFRDLDVPGLLAELDQRLDWQRRKVELPAGRYETILPPSAVADLMLDVYYATSARDADEGRTVFSRKGGGSRRGERLSPLPLTLRSDPAYPGLQAAPFLATTSSFSLLSVFDNGLPTASTAWIRDGVLNQMLCPRAWAARSEHEAAAPIDNLILESARPDGGSIEDMIGRTERGLLLTCLWYIRVVDPQTLLLTGLTRDGVYLVENGEVTGAVNNFRFNESPVELLGRVSEVGDTRIALAREMNDYFSRTAMPPLRIPDFNMSTVSQAS